MFVMDKKDTVDWLVMIAFVIVLILFGIILKTIT